MHKRRRQANVSLLALTGCLILSSPNLAASRNFEFLYINANEGTASGGHTAIKFDNEVFHFQHVANGLLRIYRDEFPAFRFQYGYQENRTIQGHRIEVDDTVYETLHAAFNHRRLIQNQQFALLNSLNADRRLILELMQTGSSTQSNVKLKALGYFMQNYDPATGIVDTLQPPLKDSFQLQQLQQAVSTAYGADFLERKRQQTWNELLSLKPSIPDQVTVLDTEQFVTGSLGFQQYYKNQLLNLAALDVLKASIAPRPETLFSTDRPEFQLSTQAKSKLLSYRQTLFQDLIKLLQSSRSDWGYPLLVGMARLHALDASLESGRLVVLDRHQTGDGSDKTQSVDPAWVQAVVSNAANSLATATQKLLTPEVLSEQNYDQIETNAITLLDILSTLQSRKTLTLPKISNTPELAATAKLVRLAVDDSQLQHTAQILEHQYTAYRQQLESLYDYQLLNHNCVTEIFSIINTTLEQKHSKPSNFEPEPLSQLSQRLLGGYIEGQNLNIIPAFAFETVRDSYRVASSYRLQPYRQQQIENQYQTGTKILVDLQESNVLSASSYHWHGEDAAFLFFTQDAIWPRPLLGGFNLAAAVGQSLYGLLALPWDAGQNLQKSLTGIAVSLPELLFFNIRKGSYPQLIPGVTPVSYDGM